MPLKSIGINALVSSINISYTISRHRTRFNFSSKWPLELRFYTPICNVNMYSVSGANLHGQWLEENPVLIEFQTLKNVKKPDVLFDINQAKLEHISWSYNLFQIANKLYLSGSWHGSPNRFIEVPLPIENLKDTRLLHTGNEHNLFICDTNSHTIWVMSLEDHTDVKRLNLFTETFVSGAIKRLKKGDTALKVCVTNHNSMYLTSSGSIYSGALPSPIDTSMCTGYICDIQCGYEHSLLLTDMGQVYSWGNGRKLQLGHGDLNNIESPKLIEALAGVTITQISAGGWHSLALSEFGDVYAWGWNDTGQLGIREISSGELDKLISVNSCDLPTLIDIYDDNGDTVNMNVKEIACGNRHSAILLEDNSVWTAGCNKYGQTGFTLETMRVDIFKKSYQCSGNSFIKCGPWVTVVSTMRPNFD